MLRLSVSGPRRAPVGRLRGVRGIVGGFEILVEKNNLSLKQKLEQQVCGVGRIEIVVARFFAVGGSDTVHIKYIHIMYSIYSIVYIYIVYIKYSIVLPGQLLYNSICNV